VLRRLIMGAICVSTLCAVPRLAGAQTSDTEMWTGAELNVDLPQRMRFAWSHSLRFDDDVARLKQAFHEVALRYRATDWLQFQGGYRFYMVRDGETAQRLFGDVGLRYRPGDSAWQFQYRLRLQNTMRPDPLEDLTYLRNKFEVSYRVNKDVTPYVAFELFYRFRDAAADEFRRYRLEGGVDWDIAKRTTLSGFLLFQSEMNVASPERDYVLGVELSYQIDAG